MFLDDLTKTLFSSLQEFEKKVTLLFRNNAHWKVRDRRVYEVAWNLGNSLTPHIYMVP